MLLPNGISMVAPKYWGVSEAPSDSKGRREGGEAEIDAGRDMRSGLMRARELVSGRKKVVASEPCC